MELTHSDLVAAGLTDEVADSVLQAHKAVLNGRYVPKSRFDDVNTRMKEAEERATQLEPLETTNKNLLERISELEATVKANRAEGERLLNAERVKFAVDNELKGIVHDVAIVTSLLDMDKVAYKDGQLTGFTEQVEALKGSKPFLFLDTSDTKKDSNSGNGVFLFGSTPASGDITLHSKPKADAESNFGAEIAKAKVDTQTRAAKGQQAYFSGF